MVTKVNKNTSGKKNVNVKLTQVTPKELQTTRNSAYGSLVR